MNLSIAIRTIVTTQIDISTMIMVEMIIKINPSFPSSNGGNVPPSIIIIPGIPSSVLATVKMLAAVEETVVEVSVVGDAATSINIFL